MPCNPTLDMIPSTGVYWMLGILCLCLWTLLDPKARGVPKILVVTGVFMLVTPMLDTFMEFESTHLPWKFDYYLYHLDESLGISGFSVASWFICSQRVLLLGLYQTLPLVILAWYALHLRRRDGTPALLLTAYIIMFTTGPLLYALVPGVGPRIAFQAAYPAGHPNVPVELVKFDGWPNAMPSIHVSTALLFLLFAGKGRIARPVAWLYLAGTVAATLALEHYMIDLIVAVPFTCFAITIAERRFRPAFSFLAVTLAWLLAIRFLTPLLILNPHMLRGLTVATLALCAFSMRQIPLIESAPPPEPVAAGASPNGGLQIHRIGSI